MIFSKNNVVSKRSFFKRKYSGRFSNVFIESCLKMFIDGDQKLLCSTFFSRYANCQLGGEGPKSQEDVRVMSAREGGPKMGLFSVS